MHKKVPTFDPQVRARLRGTWVDLIRNDRNVLKEQQY